MKLKTSPNGALKLGLAAVMVSNASAVAILTTTLVEDTFSRTGAFVGSSADTGGTWSGGNAAWTTSGTELTTTSSGFATIGISGLVPNETYTLTMDVTVDSGNWIGFGFGNSTTTSVNFGSHASLLHRASSNVELYSPVDGSSNLPVAAGFPKSLEIIIETGTTLSNSTASWYVNGAQVGADRAISAAGIDRVFLQEFAGTSGSIDNFRLTTTAPVPEPSSALLLGMGALAIMRRRRS